MLFEPFEAAWQRWDRARLHLGESVEAWNGFIDGHDAFDFVLDGDGTGTYIRGCCSDGPCPRLWQFP